MIITIFEVKNTFDVFRVRNGRFPLYDHGFRYGSQVCMYFLDIWGSVTVYVCERGPVCVSVCVCGSVCANMYICDYQCEFESVVLFFR